MKTTVKSNRTTRVQFLTAILVIAFGAAAVALCPYTMPSTQSADPCSHCDPSDPWKASNGTTCIQYVAANSVLCDCGSGKCENNSEPFEFVMDEYHGVCSGGVCSQTQKVGQLRMMLRFKFPGSCGS